ITAALRSFIVSNSVAYVLKQREGSVSQTNPVAETVGWLVMDPQNIIQGVNAPNTTTFTLSPNPVRDRIYLSGEIADGTSVSIYDVSGALVHHEMLQGNEIDVERLPSGYYILRTSESGTSKFIKL
ncbi:MAG: T9SS type A sorting domain-containing protein, partial [Bacteroidales bacterium]|nr:T9SS type A sorting domain-containing protein [Bacteroidales bacterium]